MTADKDDGWTGKGCTMRRILKSSLGEAESVKDRYEWIHEIHHWGATKYGPTCIEEIRSCLKAGTSEEGPTTATTGGVVQ